MSTAKQAASAVQNPSDLRARIKSIAGRAMNEGNRSLGRLKEVATEVIEGVADAVKDAVPHQRTAVLHKVVDGLSDSYAAAAHATRDTFDEARRRGQRLAHGPLSQTVRELKGMESHFVETIKNCAGRVGGDVRREWTSVVAHAKSAAKEIRPAAKSAIDAADGHLGELASQTAAVGAAATGTLVGGLLTSAGGGLSKLGRRIKPRAAKAKKPAAKRAKAAGGKKPAAKTKKAAARKPAKKSSKR